MKLLQALIRNHPLANILFVLVLLLGAFAYATLPREQDPEINFNWVSIITTLPGAAAEDIEKLVTGPLEDALKNVPDVRFVTSTSRESVSSILVRFRDISDRTFDKRINDLRREIQSKADRELPRDAERPIVLEITTSNGFPTAQLLLVGNADDETLRFTAQQIKNDLERLPGADRVFAAGLRKPELRVEFDAAQLATRGLTAADVADSVAAWFRDTSAGSARAAGSEWVVRVVGAEADPDFLARIPVASNGRAPQSLAPNPQLDVVARVTRAGAEATELSSYEGRPAISFAVTKKSYTNTIDLVERVDAYLHKRNETLAAGGMRLVLTDDQTVPTRDAIRVMQNNAFLGLLLVIAVCWFFLGTRISLLVGLGIPFSLAGTFALLEAFGFTLNISVLLGVVIALGMLVDDAVVVVESIYYRVQRGAEAFTASLGALRETAAPVTSSVATTLAAFLPLMLMPGIVGKFMFVIPFVVTLALAISLIEAFWMLPTHVNAIGFRLRESRVQRARNRFNAKVRVLYSRALIRVMRHRIWFGLGCVLVLAAAVGAFATGLARVQFFAFDPIRIFYVNVDLPQGTPIDETLREVEAVAARVRKYLREGEARALVSNAGQKFTETEPLYGPQYGQLVVSLLPRTKDGREVQEIVESMRAEIERLPGRGRKSFTVLSGGPPLTKPINVKVRGDDYAQLRAAADAMRELIARIPGAKDVTDDDQPGRPEMRLTLDREAVGRSGYNAAQVARLARLYVDGEIVQVIRDKGEKIDVRVLARDTARTDPAALLNEAVALPGGGVTTLGALAQFETTTSKGNIKRYNFRRTITVEANLDKEQTDTVVANRIIRAEWDKLRGTYSEVDLDFTGELDDIQESLDAMGMLFVLGIGLSYLILATQFRSYWQPLMILVTVPLAFAGVTFGLVLSGNPLSLFTMYGVVALAGIAVNSAIVLIDAANDRLKRGMSVLHAILYAARRRVIPVLITSTTTIAGLFSLAIGLGGKSLLWGPVAAAIVWGLAFSTVLTLFVVPVLYGVFMRQAHAREPATR
ncbi:MAG TPA: efflux RND transporter permease subunit [Burkholderiaceae bacterium]|nr:efflux RND transporter permease subunit [Burkholderiaceae bacterium]